MEWFPLTNEQLIKGMTAPKSVVIEKQNKLNKNYGLSFWYGTWCKKCCDVYPIHVNYTKGFEDKMWYQCEVCGRRTEPADMPWVARDDWNSGKTFIKDGQLNLTQFM